MKWSGVETIDYYGQVDGLDGKELKKGEKIEILFPDSEEHPYITNPIVFDVHTKTGEMESQVDMSGGPDNHRYSRAYVIIHYQGLPVELYIRNQATLKIRRVE